MCDAERLARLKTQCVCFGYRPNSGSVSRVERLAIQFTTPLTLKRVLVNDSFRGLNAEHLAGAS